MAARALARRIAAERGWTIGEEIGWQIRFERRFPERTQLLVATEGILTARLQADPLLSDFDASSSTSSTSAASTPTWPGAGEAGRRPATICGGGDVGHDGRRAGGAFLGAKVIDMPGARIRSTSATRPVLSMADGDHEALRAHAATSSASSPARARSRRGCAGAPFRGALPLHGSLASSSRNAALAPSRDAKIILATNVAETSLTVEG